MGKISTRTASFAGQATTDRSGLRNVHTNRTPFLIELFAIRKRLRKKGYRIRYHRSMCSVGSVHAALDPASRISPMIQAFGITFSFSRPRLPSHPHNFSASLPDRVPIHTLLIFESNKSHPRLCKPWSFTPDCTTLERNSQRRTSDSSGASAILARTGYTRV